MKQLTFLILLTVSVGILKAQGGLTLDFNSFENQILSFQPNQENYPLSEDYLSAELILESIQSSTNGRPDNFIDIDYWNATVVLIILKESKENIKMAFEKFKLADESCRSIIAYSPIVEKESKFEIIIEDFRAYHAECKSKEVEKEEFNLLAYCEEHNLNLELTQLVYNVHLDDIKYRNTEEFETKQRPLDLKNLALIDSLFVVHNTYIGNSLAGKKLGSTMFLVIQHSNPETMEKYLPVVHKAVQENEIHVSALKILIDRFYGLSYGYQIFGSQIGFGFDLANDKVREEIKLKYGIE